HRQGRVLPLDDHPQRIADEQCVRAAIIEDAGEGRVVGGDHADLLADLLVLLQRLDGALVLHGSPPVGLGWVLRHRPLSPSPTPWVQFSVSPPHGRKSSMTPHAPRRAGSFASLCRPAGRAGAEPAANDQGFGEKEPGMYRTPSRVSEMVRMTWAW